MGSIPHISKPSPGNSMPCRGIESQIRIDWRGKSVSILDREGCERKEVRRTPLAVFVIWAVFGIYLLFTPHRGIVFFIIGAYLLFTIFVFSVGWMIQMIDKRKK
jgi:hypothetical protein